MGIVNVTPDSFSDGGLFEDPGSAVAHAVNLINQGAHIIDVGGESTRPGSTGIDEEEEKKRVLPVIKSLAAKTDAMISIDTVKPGVATSDFVAAAESLAASLVVPPPGPPPKVALI